MFNEECEIVADEDQGGGEFAVVYGAGDETNLDRRAYDADIPRTIERLLETHLGITDRRVKGEYTG
ncbi:MAG: hypothetical protein KDA93_03710 [Planctomycetaceae bacterium]|nr:hypothetical protein [Planctomycetaceae bacterium]